MATINSSDIMMATATLCGRRLASFTFSGFTSVAEVVAAVRDSVGPAFGIINLELRNSTQGWRRKHNLYIPRAY